MSDLGNHNAFRHLIIKALKETPELSYENVK